jgi:hypothetical protein
VLLVDPDEEHIMSVTATALDHRVAPVATATRSPLARVTTVAAVAWIAIATESIVRPDAHDYRDVAMAVPFGLLGVVVLGVHRLHRGSFGRAGAAAAVFALGWAASLAGTVAAGFDAGWSEPLLGAAMAPFVLGLAGIGIETIRGGVLPKHVGWALIVSQPGAALVGVALSWHVPLASHGSYSGGLAHAAAMATVARAVTRKERRSQRG